MYRKTKYTFKCKTEIYFQFHIAYLFWNIFYCKWEFFKQQFSFVYLLSTLRTYLLQISIIYRYKCTTNWLFFLFFSSLLKKGGKRRKKKQTRFSTTFFYRRKSINLFCTLFYIKPIQFLTVLLIFLVACVQTCQVVAHPEPVDIHHG